MTLSSRGRLRRLWFNVHLWLGVGLAVLLIPLGLTGSVLVWSDGLLGADPGRVISGPATASLPPSAYLAAAEAALKGEARPTTLKLPERAGDPVGVLARGRPPAAAPGGPAARPGRAPQITVWLNPSDARVLSIARGRPGWWMTVHSFHENLLVRGWGRAAVGWLGVAMLVSSLTGIWLWWPRSGAVLKGFRFRRTPGFWLNVHHMAGFWISLPLAFVSLTGIGLGFPQETRALIGNFALVSPPSGAAGPERAAPPDGQVRGPRAEGGPGREGRGDGGHSGGWRPALGPDEALARSGVAPSALRALTLPSRAAPVWKVEREGGPPLQVADAGGAVSPSPPPPGGDVAWRWIHRLHGGDDLPLLWRLIVTLCGFAPTLLGITGVAVWIAKLRRRKAAVAV